MDHIGDAEGRVIQALGDCSGMRLGVLSIASEFLLNLGRRGSQGYEVVENPLPKDADIVGATINGRGDVALIIESAEYPPFKPDKSLFSIPRPVMRTKGDDGWSRGPMPTSAGMI